MHSNIGPSLPAYELGLFDSRSSAHEAIRALIAEDFNSDDISFFVQASDSDLRDPPDGRIDAAIELGGNAGAGVGAAAGSTGGVLLGLGLLSVPGVGPLVAVGPLAAGITGAIAGGAFGGFAGSLAGFGISEAQSLAVERHVKSGNSIVAVRCGDRATTARSILAAHGAIVEP